MLIKIFAIFLFIPTLSFHLNAEVILFDHIGMPVKNYDQLVKDHSQDNVFSFDDGMSYKTIGYLGSGSNTHNYLVENQLVLRLPTSSDTSLFNLPQFINETIEGAALLEAAQINIPHIHQFSQGQYTLVDYISFNFTAYDFFAQLEINHSVTMFKDAAEDLIDFSKTTHLFESIGDFSPDQIVYSHENRQWTLLDYTSIHELINNQEDNKHVFQLDFKKKLEEVLDEKGILTGKRMISSNEQELLAKIETAIISQRKEHINLSQELLKLFLDQDDYSQKLSLKTATCQDILNSF